MKRAIIGFVLGLLIALPVSVHAYDVSTAKWPKIIYRFDGSCTDNNTDTTGESCGKVASFDDQGNKCYIAYTGKESTSISCVRMNQ
jgi:hypothetical protein